MRTQGLSDVKQSLKRVLNYVLRPSRALAEKEAQFVQLQENSVKIHEAFAQSQKVLAQKDAEIADLIEVRDLLRLSQDVLAQKDAQLARLRGETSRLNQQALPEKDAELAGLREEALRRGQEALAQKHAQPAARRDEFDTLAAQLTPYKGRPYTDFTDAEKSIYLKSAMNLCGGPEAVVSLIRAVEYVIRNGIPGALVECGVFMGGNIEVMIRVLQNLQIDDRDIYLYDTFAGMPQPDPRDDNGLGGAMKISWEAHRTEADGTSGSDWMRAPVETVRQRIEPLGYRAERLHFVKGMVEDTIPGVAPEKIAILRLDTDFYSSTKHELQHLYPRLMPGGILIIDDYGAIPGARLAADEYTSENDLGWFLHRVDPHVRLAVKPKTS
jgi:O-methyltransferase